jgi:hypothetical protein
VLWVIILALTLLGAAVHARAAGQGSARKRTPEIFLVYTLAGYYGVAMLLAAAVHLKNPAGIAGLKGWAPSEPFQTLYAFALLGMAASAFLSIWWRGTYLLGPALSGSVLLLGGAYLHGSEVLQTGRFGWLKDGPEMLLDLVVPIGVLGLAYVHKRSLRQGGP